MASFRAHKYVDFMFFARSFPKIHREMDRPFKRLGRHHRMVNHNVFAAFQIAEKNYPGNFFAVRAALLHITIDENCSRDSEFRKTLEAAAILWSGKRRKRGWY
jgi:hypothetical protein